MNNLEKKLITRTEIEFVEQKKIYNMHFGAKDEYSVVLMSVQTDAPYDDQKIENGIIIYQGHDNTELHQSLRKSSDQSFTRYGKPTANSDFYKAASSYSEGSLALPRAVRVYEKIGTTYWTCLGFYALIKATFESNGYRKVFSFWLDPNFDFSNLDQSKLSELRHNRAIPREIKQYVMYRDKGRCKNCNSAENIQFDHVLPFSQGGTSLDANNIQILCVECNQKKGNSLIY